MTYIYVSLALSYMYLQLMVSSTFGPELKLDEPVPGLYGPHFLRPSQIIDIHLIEWGSSRIPCEYQDTTRC